MAINNLSTKHRCHFGIMYMAKIITWCWTFNQKLIYLRVTGLKVEASMADQKSLMKNPSYTKLFSISYESEPRSLLLLLSSTSSSSSSSSSYHHQSCRRCHHHHHILLLQRSWIVHYKMVFFHKLRKLLMSDHFLRNRALTTIF